MCRFQFVYKQERKMNEWIVTFIEQMRKLIYHVSYNTIVIIIIINTTQSVVYGLFHSSFNWTIGWPQKKKVWSFPLLNAINDDDELSPFCHIGLIEEWSYLMFLTLVIN